MPSPRLTALILLLSALSPASFAAQPNPALPSGENHLAGQHSPYLIQHLHNPVDWYPWGPEAFEKAKKENKPVFLSVGYSTCHWCHVMETDCFENKEVAALLNASFVCIKVDREERPDIDRLYMNFLQASTGGGGWPMTLFLTPDLQPFFGATYIPSEDQNGRPGFKTLISRIANLWANNPAQIRQQASQILTALTPEAPGDTTSLHPAQWRAAAVRELARLYDAQHGGFEQAPKFPNAVFLSYLLDYAITGDDAELCASARAMGLSTLSQCLQGGLRDHVGGGFHRYSVDAAWRLPHFEKMLCDQALLGSVCLDAWLLTGEEEYLRTNREILAYLEARLRLSPGGYATAEDADGKPSPDCLGGPHGEGASYLWRKAEIDRILGETESAFFCEAYEIHTNGNLSDAGSGFEGLNQPRLKTSLPELAAGFKLKPSEFLEHLQPVLSKLHTSRLQRPLPALDDKVLSGWNGLALSLLARTAFHTRDLRQQQLAVALAGFLRKELCDPASGKLLHSLRNGHPGPFGFAEDYAFVIQGLLDLFQTTQEPSWLDWAMQLQARQDELFHDDKEGGWFASEKDSAGLLLRLKGANDGSEPSANSVSVKNRQRLANLLHQPDFASKTQNDLLAFAGTMKDSPLSLPTMLEALGRIEGPVPQLIIQGNPEAPATCALVDVLRRRLMPGLSLIVLHDGNRKELERLIPFLKEFPETEQASPLAYLCLNNACNLPVSKPADLASLLDRALKKAR